MIETERIILRPWREEDAADLYRVARDPEVGPAAGWAPHPSEEYSREVIRTVFSAPEVYAIVLKETVRAVGCCGIVFPDGKDDAREGEIGYWIGREYWGRGLVPEAARSLLARCFNELGLKMVWCAFYDGNIKSQRVCEKCGFKYHHTDPDILTPLGDRRTEHHYVLEP